MARQAPVVAACAARVAARISSTMMWLEFFVPGAHKYHPSDAQLAMKKRFDVATANVHLRVSSGVMMCRGNRHSTISCGVRPSSTCAYQAARVE